MVWYGWNDRGVAMGERGGLGELIYPCVVKFECMISFDDMS